MEFYLTYGFVPQGVGHGRDLVSIEVAGCTARIKFRLSEMQDGLEGAAKEASCRVQSPDEIKSLVVDGCRKALAQLEDRGDDPQQLVDWELSLSLLHAQERAALTQCAAFS